MTRKLNVKISDGIEFNEEKEGLSFKKIIKAIQDSVPKNTTRLKVQYTNRKGNFIDRWIRIPMGREKTLGR